MANVLKGCRNTEQLCLHWILYLFPSLGEYYLKKNLGVYWQISLKALSDTLPFSLLAFWRSLPGILCIQPRGLGWTLTFKWRHGLQDAKLLENCHEKDDDHTNGKQFHSLDPHDSWMEGVAEFSGPSLCETWPSQRAERRPRPGRVNPDLMSQRVLSGGNQGSVWLERDSMGLVPGPEKSVKARAASWMKAALKSTLMLKWKICGSRHIWKTSLSRPMGGNGGCVTSHLLKCIKRDV